MKNETLRHLEYRMRPIHVTGSGVYTYFKKKIDVVYIRKVYGKTAPL